MPKTFLKKSTGWTEMKSIFVKKSTGWTETKSIFIKKLVTSQFGQLATWVKVYTKASLPDTTTPPSIRTTNTSGVGDAYDGPAAISPRYLNDNLFGKDGAYTNFTSKFGRKFTKANAAAALPAERTTVVTGDLFTSGGGVTEADRVALDGKYLFFEMTVQNGSSANEIQSVSSAIKMIKRAPTTTDFQWTGVEQAGTELVLNYVYENYYYNSIDPALSYIKWWRNTSPVPGGTLIKTETITATTTGTPSSTSRSGTSRYTPSSVTDIGFYIIAETTAVNSFTVHNAYTDNYTVASFPTGIIGAPLVFSNVSVQDGYNNNGLDNRGRWPAGSLNKYVWTLNGYDASTTIRIRYRMYNYDTARYYKISTETIQADTTAGAEAAYDSYVSTPGATNYISSVSVSGTTATCYDYLDLSSTTLFNGGGAGPTWWLEIELSATKGIGRVYEQGYTGGYMTYYTGKSIDSSISVSPSTVARNANVTISGSLIGYPATPSTNGYPRQYKVDYGDSTDSGWLPVGEYASGTLNPTYSLTKQYSAAGIYTVSIQTIPDYEYESASLTVTTSKVPPTMGTPTLSALGAFVTGERRLSVPFTAVTDSGPAYQIYWHYSTSTPGVSVTPDGSRTISPVLDETGPYSIGRCYVFIRSSATTTTTGTSAPSTTLSDWSAGTYIDISGTRTLSYDKNTTDAVTSLPSASSGTDPWNGWVTTVSANTPTRTGYTFNGYNTQANGLGTNYAASATITLTSAVTLYAKWTPNTYAVTYYGNSNTGGSVPDAQTKTYGVDLTLRTNVNTLARTNYVFSGWNTASDGSGTNYAVSATYSSNATLDLYAKWLPLYLVSFNVNGGTGTVPNALRQSTSGGSVTLPGVGSMTAPTAKPNFSGWVATSTGTTALTGAYTPTGNVTLYAYWTANLPTTTAVGVRGYNNFGVTITLPTGTGSVVLSYGSTTAYGTSIGTYTTAGTKSPVGPLLANTTYYFRAIPYSGTAGDGTAGTAVTGSVSTYVNPAHTASTPVNPTFQRFTSGVNSYIRYGWNNQSALTPTGDYSEWGYEFRVYSNSGLTTQLSGSPFYQAYNTISDSRLINGLTRIYVFSGEGSGTPYSGNFTYTTSAVYGRYRPYYISHGSTTKVFGNYSNAI